MICRMEDGRVGQGTGYGQCGARAKLPRRLQNAMIGIMASLLLRPGLACLVLNGGLGGVQRHSHGLYLWRPPEAASSPPTHDLALATNPFPGRRRFGASSSPSVMAGPGLGLWAGPSRARLAWAARLDSPACARMRRHGLSGRRANHASCPSPIPPPFLQRLQRPRRPAKPPAMPASGS